MAVDGKAETGRGMVMKEKYRNSNRAKHRYKALERVYILYAGCDAVMAEKIVDTFRAWLRQDRRAHE